MTSVLHCIDQSPPFSPERLLCRERARRDDEEDVEHGRPDDGADAHVRLGDEDADDRGEQLGGAAARSHEGGAGHVGTDAKLVGETEECYFIFFSCY